MLQPPGGATARRPTPSNRRKTQESPDDILRQLQRFGPNKKCADCNALASQCANLTIGSFVCITCSGILRELNHRVKGIGHSSFTQEEAERMKQSNNEEINKIYLARFNPANEHLKQPQGNSDQQLLRAWIRRKYHDKAWYKEPGIGISNDKPTVVKIPSKEQVDLLGSFGNSPTTTNNDSAWNAFGGSQAQQQQQVTAFNPSFPVNFPSQPPPQAPNNAFPANFGSSQTLQQHTNFANFPPPNNQSSSSQQPGFANFNQAPTTADPIQQQSFANYNQLQQSQSQQQPHQPQNFANFSQQQHNPPAEQQQRFANFNQQQANPAQHLIMAGQQHGFASLNAQGQQQSQVPQLQQGFGYFNQQQVQQGMLQGQQQNQTGQTQSQPLQHQTSLPQQSQAFADLTQQHQFNQQAQQQFHAPQQQHMYGQISFQQQPSGAASSNASQPTSTQNGGVPQGAYLPGFHGVLPQQQVQQQAQGLQIQPQPTTPFSPSFGMPVQQSMPNGAAPPPPITDAKGSEGGQSGSASAIANVSSNEALSLENTTNGVTPTPKVTSPSIGNSKFSAGQLVVYKSDTETCAAKIVKVHFDDALDPFYTIVLDNGKEKQTDDAHLVAQEFLRLEINEMLRLLTPVQLNQVHEYLIQLEIAGKMLTSNGSSKTEKTGQPPVSGQPSSAVLNSSVSNSISSTPSPGIHPAVQTPTTNGTQQQTKNATQSVDRSGHLIPNTQLTGNKPSQGQFQSNQSGQGSNPPQAPAQSGQDIHGLMPSQAHQEQSIHPQGQSNFQSLQITTQQGFSQTNVAGLHPSPVMANPSISQQLVSFQQQPLSNPPGHGVSGFIPSPPAVSNSLPVQPSGLPAPPLVQPTSIQQQPQQFQQPAPQQQQPHFQQFHNHVQMQQPANGGPSAGDPASPMSPKGNPFDFY